MMTTEDLLRESDLVVLVRVTATEPDGINVGPQKELFTRHTVKIEASCGGKASDDIALLTRGGVETRVVGDQILRTATTGVDVGESVRVDEELLIFLKAVPEGYVFVDCLCARHPVYLNESIKGQPESTVNLFFIKKKYMRGFALEGFENLERLEGAPNPSMKVEAALKGTRGLEMPIPVKELRSKLAEVREKLAQAADQQHHPLSTFPKFGLGSSDQSVE